ncbi:MULTISPECIES: SRPBCC family protein [unclassified Streptomyces]|uniref:SRPBCC family protein n=1 Tax=unclassified Streptomyces TaxID=2593676 RepID=UPI002E10EF90|nr:SRPBCC family protein [Streptomyces sp. NBC_01205]
MTETVTRIEYTLPVNDPAAEEQVRLTRDDVWTGLVAKAADPRPYVPAITECTVLSENPQGLVREIARAGDRFREVVVFDIGHRVSFRRSDDKEAWTIDNVIDEDPTGALTLTFSGEFGYEIKESRLAAMRTSMAKTVARTLAVIREDTAA